MYLCKFVRDCILIINRGAVNCRLRNDFKGRGLKMGVFVGGGGGGLTWTLILRIFGMVSITFFFAPPLDYYIYFLLSVWGYSTPKTNIACVLSGRDVFQRLRELLWLRRSQCATSRHSQASKD